MVKKNQSESKEKLNSDIKSIMHLRDRWIKDRIKNPVELIIEISDNPRVGEIVNVISRPWTDYSNEEYRKYRKDRKKPPKDYKLNVTLLNEVLKESSLLSLTNWLSNLKQNFGYDNRQTFAYLLQFYIMITDLELAKNGNQSILEAPNPKELEKESKEKQILFKAALRKPRFHLGDVVNLWDAIDIRVPELLLGMPDKRPGVRVWTYLPPCYFSPSDINKFVSKSEKYINISNKLDVATYSSNQSFLRSKVTKHIDDTIKNEPFEKSLRRGDHNNIIGREGNNWKIIFNSGNPILLKGVGASYIAHLINLNGSKIHVSKLVSHINPPSFNNQMNKDDSIFHEVGMNIIENNNNAGPIIDNKALSEFKKRVKELEIEIEEAERIQDIEKISKLKTESYIIKHQIRKSRKLGNKTALLDDKGERDRVSVRNAIDRTLEKIKIQDIKLYAHLTEHLKTGYHCFYGPVEGSHWYFPH